MGKVVVVGSFNMDMVVRTAKAPQAGETVMGQDFFTANGGKGANQAVAAARLGADVTLGACVGNDEFGDTALRSLEQEGIFSEYVTRSEKLPTGTAMIILDAKGENSIVVAPGANSAFLPTQVQKMRPAIAVADVVLAQLEIPVESVVATFELARSADKTTILNPAPARELSDTLLNLTTVITPNETEAESLTGIAVHDLQSAEKSAQVLHARGVPTVIITLGSRGAYVSAQNFRELIPTRKSNVVDTTAAGDVFSGALATGLSEGLALPAAVAFACQAASLSVEKLGAQPSIPFRQTLTVN